MLLKHLTTIDDFWRGVFALMAGIVTLFAYAPFSFYPLAILGPALLFMLWLEATPRQALFEGWAFGMGLLGFGVFWMHISIDQFGNVGTPLAILITLLFVAAMSLYYGLVGWLSKRLFSTFKPTIQLLLVFPVVWVLVEWLRGWFLSGFPWLALGYSQIDSFVGGFAPVVGVYGVSLAVAVSSGLLVMAYSDRRINPFIALVLALAIWGNGYMFGQVQWTKPLGDALTASLIQGNIAQEAKWNRDNLLPTLELYSSLTQQNWDSDIIIWPETAVPAFMHQVDDALLTPLQDEAIKHNSGLLMGLPVWQQEGERYYNALLSLDGERDLYYKRHLVPFGEFMPLKALIGPVLAWIEIPMSDFSAGESEQPIIQLGGRPVGVSICYEDAFGEETIEALPEAQYLVNVSNDAWFGDSLAMPQHLEIARMRALETGRYLLRATNTGISALIDEKGRVKARSPRFKQHILTGDFQPMQGSTPYVRTGNLLLIGTLILVLFLMLFFCRHHRCRIDG